jgi:hypothetical protein
MRLLLLGIGLIVLVTSCQDLGTMGTYEKIWFTRGVQCARMVIDTDLNYNLTGRITPGDILEERAINCFNRAIKATRDRRE